MTDLPSPPYKGLMMLEYVARAPYGWGESLWINKPSYEDSLSTLQELANRRLALLPKTIRLVAIRVTHPQVWRASLYQRINQTGTYEDEPFALQSWYSLFLRFASGVYYSNYTLA